VIEYLLLRNAFKIKDKKKQRKLRDEFIKDMNFNFQASEITKALP